MICSFIIPSLLILNVLNIGAGPPFVVPIVASNNTAKAVGLRKLPIAGATFAVRYEKPRLDRVGDQHTAGTDWIFYDLKSAKITRSSL